MEKSQSNRSGFETADVDDFFDLEEGLNPTVVVLKRLECPAASCMSEVSIQP